MINWSPYFKKHSYPFGYLKLLLANYKYFDHVTIDKINPMLLNIFGLNGDQTKIAKLRNKHKGERCFIIGNGPSISKMDLSHLKNEITIGCNGIYKNFDQWGFHTTYYITEDVVQTELRGKEISNLKGPMKFAALYNAHSLNLKNDFTYFYVPKIRNYHDYYWEKELYPQFSEDFSTIVHLGGTVAYIMMQFAFHLGFDEVYFIGIDHNYGKLPELFQPGKITVTEENYELVQQCHFDKDYYKIGDVLGVPNVDRQNKAYEKCKEIFESKNKIIKNAGIDSKLDIFETVNFKDLF
jgi:hypothetical protein